MLVNSDVSYDRNLSVQQPVRIPLVIPDRAFHSPEPFDIKARLRLRSSRLRDFSIAGLSIWINGIDETLQLFNMEALELDKTLDLTANTEKLSELITDTPLRQTNVIEIKCESGQGRLIIDVGITASGVDQLVKLPGCVR